MVGDRERTDAEHIYAAGARRNFGLGLTIFSGLLVVEGLSHLGSTSPSLMLIPLAGALAVTVLRVRSKSDPRMLRHAGMWLLLPWAVSMATILNHLPTEPLLALLFVSMTAVLLGATILTIRPFAISLPLTLLAQIVCLYLMPELPRSVMVIAPLSAAGIAILINVSRRREIRTADLNARLERAAFEKQARIVRLEHEREQARLEATVEERTLELEESRHRFREQEKLAAMGSLAAGVAHQVNNPVGAILIAADYALMVEEESGGQSEQEEALREIRRQAVRCGEMVRQLLRYSRGPEGERQSTRLDELLESVVRVTRDFVEEKGLVLSLEIGPGLLSMIVSANPVELEEALVNMIRNAAEATSGLGTRIDVRAARVEDWGEIRIVDDGPGVEGEAVPRLFEPFFTTRLNEGGTGLGLSLAHRIVEDHGGQILYEPSPSGGAIFRIRLPASKEGEAPVIETRKRNG